MTKHAPGTVFTAAIRRLGPGALLAGVLGWFSIWFSKFLGETVLGFATTPISSAMTAILLGLIVGNVVALPEQMRPGLAFAVKKILRLGIILLGIRLSLAGVVRMGAIGLPIVVGSIAGALVLTMLLARLLHLPPRLGTLIAVGTSICGVSAIVATGPAIEAGEEEMAYAVSVITIFGLCATIAYPSVAYSIFAGDAVAAGLFLGTAVHDTSQVTGAALLYSEMFSQPQALEVAVVVKLVRNLFMALVIPVMAYLHNRRPMVAQSQTAEGAPGADGAPQVRDAALEDRGAAVRSGSAAVRASDAAVKAGGAAVKARGAAAVFPLFVLGFLLMALVRTAGDVTLRRSGAAFGLIAEQAWLGVSAGVASWSINFLVVALAAVGLTTRFSSLKRLGWAPLLTGMAAALIVGLIAFVFISVAVHSF